MRFFITGITGFVGVYLAELLLEQGHDVNGVARDEGGIAALHRRYGDRFPTSAVTLCDLRDRDALRAALRRSEPRGVFHLAGMAFVPATFERPELAYEVNFLGTVEVLSAVREIAPAARVVQVTSGEIYGAIDPTRDLPLTEEQPLRPLSPYSVAKAAADLSGFQFFRTHGLDVIRARPFNHTGPGQAPTFVCPEFAKALAAAELGVGPARLLVGNLDVERDFSDVRDVVRGYLALFEHGVAGEAYNLGSGVSTSVRSILEELRRSCRVPVAVDTDPKKVRPSDVPRIAGSIEKIRRGTGWQPTIPLSVTLADLFAEWRARLQGQSA